MITIENAKVTIPNGEEIVGYAGDDNHQTKTFLIKNKTYSNNSIFRLYLQFDDDSCNYFTLPFTKSENDTTLVWNIKKEHIYKGGNIKCQLKAFIDDETIYHTEEFYMVCDDSIEFGEFFCQQPNSEYSSMELTLNKMYDKVKDFSTKPPTIGANGNWYIYDYASGIYADSGVSAAGSGAYVCSQLQGTKTLEYLSTLSSGIYFATAKAEEVNNGCEFISPAVITISSEYMYIILLQPQNSISTYIALSSQYKYSNYVALEKADYSKNDIDNIISSINNRIDNKADTTTITQLNEAVNNNTTQLDSQRKQINSNVGDIIALKTGILQKYNSSNIETGTGDLTPNIPSQVSSASYVFTRIGNTVILTVRAVISNPTNATLQTVHFTTLPYRNTTSFNGILSSAYGISATSRSDAVAPTRYAISANSTWSNFIRGTSGQSFQDGEILTATIIYNIA